MPSAYPATVAECLDDSIRYRRATLAAARAYRELRPWSGPRAVRERKLWVLHEALCLIYGVDVPLVIQSGAGCSGGSNFNTSTGRITLRGRLSVVTYLHEFAHALGKLEEREACRWSINLFRRVFPRQFARLRAEGHTLRATPRRRRPGAAGPRQSIRSAGRRRRS